MLHWGVKRPGRGGDWLAPPDNVKPPNTNMPGGGSSAETPFTACTGGLCDVHLLHAQQEASTLYTPSGPSDRCSALSRLYVRAPPPFPTDEDCMLDWDQVDYEPEDFGGSTHPLQRIRLQIPSGHNLSAVTFVIRSEDGERRASYGALALGRG